MHSFTRFCCMVLAYVGISTSAHASDLSATEEWFRELGALGHVSLLEPAGSHGSTGMSFGAGAAMRPYRDSNVAQTELGSSSKNQDSMTISQVQIVKGLPLPIDVGFTGGKFGDGTFTQATGHIQWTMYEGLAMPAIALRGSHGRVFGLQASTLNSESIELVGSYGFLHVLNVYGSIGAIQHDAVLRANRLGSTAFLLSPVEESTEFHKSWTSQISTVGVRVIALPPFLAVTAEAQRGELGSSYAAKLSFGI